MIRSSTVAGLAVVSAIGLVLRRRSAVQRRWRSVTIAAPAFDPAASPVLQPLLGAVEFRTARAGDRGIELHARVRSPWSASSEQVRTALRDAKQLAETGEVLRVDPRPHGVRRRTLLGSVQDLVERRARGLGLL